MATVVGPLLSLSASGTIGDVITFVCGHYVRKAEGKKFADPSAAQSNNQNKWKAGCVVWQALAGNKDLWKALVEAVQQSGQCPARESYELNGFQLFMSFYMDLGPDGWPNYPLPPA